MSGYIVFGLLLSNRLPIVELRLLHNTAAYSVDARVVRIMVIVFTAQITCCTTVCAVVLTLSDVRAGGHSSDTPVCECV